MTKQKTPQEEQTMKGFQDGREQNQETEEVQNYKEAILRLAHPGETNYQILLRLGEISAHLESIAKHLESIDSKK